jgi:hypothetical protein
VQRRIAKAFADAEKPAAAGGEPLRRTLFDEATAEVVDLMEKDSFSR